MPEQMIVIICRDGYNKYMARYALYNLIDQNIDFKYKGVNVSGLCTDVKREVLENQIFITVGGNKFTFSEPTKIEENGDGSEIVLVYGKESQEDLTEFCGESFSVKWGEDIRKSIGRERALFKIGFNIQKKKKEEV